MMAQELLKCFTGAQRPWYWTSQLYNARSDWVKPLYSQHIKCLWDYSPKHREQQYSLPSSFKHKNQTTRRILTPFTNVKRLLHPVHGLLFSKLEVKIKNFRTWRQPTLLISKLLILAFNTDDAGRLQILVNQTTAGDRVETTLKTQRHLAQWE